MQTPYCTWNLFPGLWGFVSPGHSIKLNQNVLLAVDELNLETARYVIFTIDADNGLSLEYQGDNSKSLKTQ